MRSIAYYLAGNTYARYRAVAIELPHVKTKNDERFQRGSSSALIYHGQRAVGRHETDYPGVRKNVRR